MVERYYGYCRQGRLFQVRMQGYLRADANNECSGTCANQQACTRIVTKDDSGQEKVSCGCGGISQHRDTRRGCNPPAGDSSRLSGVSSTDSSAGNNSWPPLLCGTITAISFLSTSRSFQEIPHSPQGMPASPGTTMAKRSRTYIWQFTIGLGFLSGLWTAIGIDPEEVILNILGTVTGEMYPDPTPPAAVHPPSSHPPRPPGNGGV